MDESFLAAPILLVHICPLWPSDRHKISNLLFRKGSLRAGAKPRIPDHLGGVLAKTSENAGVGDLATKSVSATGTQ